jgi:hypothetical protein
MAELKTKVNAAGVEGFLKRVANDQRREDAFAIVKMLRAVTRKTPKMWGPSIVGFDQYHYTYASGREGDICLLGFSPRSQAFVLYGLLGSPASAALLKKLGRYTTGKGCLYIKKLDDVDTAVLRQLVTKSYRHAKAKHESGR